MLSSMHLPNAQHKRRLLELRKEDALQVHDALAGMGQRGYAKFTPTLDGDRFRKEGCV